MVILPSHAPSLASRRHNRPEIQLPGSSELRRIQKRECILALPLRLRRRGRPRGGVREVWQPALLRVSPKGRLQYGEPEPRRCARESNPALSGLGSHDSALLQPQYQSLSGLWRPGHRCDAGLARGLSCFQGLGSCERISATPDNRAQKQRRPLRARQLLLGHAERAGEQPPEQRGPLVARQNAGLDTNKDGKVTKREAAAKVAGLLDEGRRPGNVG